MSEELKEIRDALDCILQHLESRKGTVDECKISGVEAFRLRRSSAALREIEAREAEAPKDALQLAVEIVGQSVQKFLSKVSIETYSHEAAAEIERYVQSRITAAPKTVPYIMLCKMPSLMLREDIEALAARYGYEVTE